MQYYKLGTAEKADGIQEVGGSICLWVYVSNEHCNGSKGGLGKHGADIKWNVFLVWVRFVCKMLLCVVFCEK